MVVHTFLDWIQLPNTKTIQLQNLFQAYQIRISAELLRLFLITPSRSTESLTQYVHYIRTSSFHVLSN